MSKSSILYGKSTILGIENKNTMEIFTFKNKNQKILPFQRRHKTRSSRAERIKHSSLILQNTQTNKLQTNWITDNIFRNYFEWCHPAFSYYNPFRGNIHHVIAVFILCTHQLKPYCTCLPSELMQLSFRSAVLDSLLCQSSALKQICCVKYDRGLQENFYISQNN